MTFDDTLTYEEKQKLKWKNIARNWDYMDDTQKGEIAYQITHHTPPSWIPKQLLYDAFIWLVYGLENERLEIVSLCENKRNQFKLID